MSKKLLHSLEVQPSYNLQKDAAAGGNEITFFFCFQRIIIYISFNCKSKSNTTNYLYTGGSVILFFH